MWPYPRIFAHRGGGTLAPENTLAAMRTGYAHGFRAVEFDVMLSRDKVPVLMHDPEFGRTIAGKGAVADYDAAELLGMDAGKWHGNLYAGERVPSYTEVVRYCRAQGIFMNVEIKPAPGHEVETGAVTAASTLELFADVLAAGGGPAQLPLFSSFEFEAVMAAKRVAPAIPRAMLLDQIPSDWADMLLALDAVALHTNHRHLTPALAQEIKVQGYGLFCYTVNSVERAREILAWGVDGFCTDRIDLIPPDFA